MLDPIDLDNLKKTLSDIGAAVTKSVGQHYLIDQNIRDQILAAGQLESGDTVVEIGPGVGSLTCALISKVKKVIAIEKDRRIGEYLRQQRNPKLKIIIADALLRLPYLEISEPYKIISNLPYQITTPAIHEILERDPLPSLVVLMVQAEVARRLIAAPGERERGIITVLAEASGGFEKIADVSPAAFWPRPKVESAIVRLRPKRVISRQDYRALKIVVKAGFSARRKTLANSLSAGLGITRTRAEKEINKSKIDPAIRAEKLSLERWLVLTRTISAV